MGRLSVLSVWCAVFSLALAQAPAGAQQEPPYPPSPVITGVEWDSTIIRQADGSDNWPITWGDDDNLYTAYGDGWGFEPRVPDKLSLGFARIEGHPPDFRGVNIRGRGGERLGDGQSGNKASGILMLDGILYMWVRNANNAGEESQLAWSTDRAQTWTWSPWRFSEFGYPTFINYGRDYAGARDDFVYAVSPDHPSAYEPGDQFILMRVPKDQITERSAYEFFAGFDGDDPQWSSDVTQRVSVFDHSGQSNRSGISFNPGIDRYLWWQRLPVGDTRFNGGFGIYDAPEPWGPWTTVYFTENWDVGPGETGSFPTKWMSPDGRTAYLVFSGDDHFSVRKATFTVVPEPPSELLTLIGLLALTGYLWRRRSGPCEAPIDRR